MIKINKTTWRQATEEENEIIRELLIEDIQFVPKSLKDYISGANFIFVVVVVVCIYSAIISLHAKYYIACIIFACLAVYGSKPIIDGITDKKKQEQLCKNLSTTNFLVKDIEITKIISHPDGFEPSRKQYSVKIKDDSKQIKRSYKLLTKDGCELGPALLVDTKLQRYNGRRVVVHKKKH